MSMQACDICKATHKQDTVSASHQPKSESGTLESFMELQFPDGHWLKFGITCFHCLPILVFRSILFGGLETSNTSVSPFITRLFSFISPVT